MGEVADLVAMVAKASGKEDVAIAEAGERATTLARSFQTVHWTLPGTESGSAYDHFALACELIAV